jgi:hypothetical protein
MGERSASYHHRQLYPRGKSPAQRRSGRCGVKKKLLLLPGIKLRPSSPQLYRLTYTEEPKEDIDVACYANFSKIELKLDKTHRLEMHVTEEYHIRITRSVSHNT